jgi:RNA polymerase sigma-70 factor, ECF subfamily
MPNTPIPRLEPSQRPSSLESRVSGLAELARAAASGNVAATQALLKALAPGMIRSAHAVMGRAHPDVDDVIQQSLIGLVQALPAFRGECSPPHFAARIVARTAVAATHRAKVRGDRRDDSLEVDGFESDGQVPQERIDAERRRAVVQELLTELPEEQAETLALRVVMGFSLGEVADATGTPLNTVRSRIRLAKEALRKRIDGDQRLKGMLEVDA